MRFRGHEVRLFTLALIFVLGAGAAAGQETKTAAATQDAKTPAAGQDAKVAAASSLARATISKAQTAIGDPNSIQYSATGTFSALGQDFNQKSPWRPTVLNSYTRTIDYPSRSAREEFVRTQQNPPALGGEAPFAGEQRQVNVVSGNYAWNQPGNAPVPANAAAAERQILIWVTPHGFLKAAAQNNATAKSGKDLGKKVTVLSFMIGKNKVIGDVDEQGLVTVVKTWIPNFVLGDTPVETRYSAYKDFDGVKFPTHIVQMEEGRAVLDLNVTSARAGDTGAAQEVPAAVQQATAPPVRVASQKLADGVWFLGGGTHNSVLIEFKDYVAVFEAPNNEARSNAVIAEVKKLAPGKPIKYVINSHHHFDHSGGLRTYVAAGAIVVTNEANKKFYQMAWKQPWTLDSDALSKNPTKAKFVTFKDKYVLTDGARTLNLYRVAGGKHDDVMTFGYLPKEKILIEADEFTPPAPNAPPLVPIAMESANNLYGDLQTMKLDVVTIAPLHGNVAPFAALPQAIGKRAGN